MDILPRCQRRDTLFRPSFLFLSILGYASTCSGFRLARVYNFPHLSQTTNAVEYQPSRILPEKTGLPMTSIFRDVFLPSLTMLVVVLLFISVWLSSEPVLIWTFGPRHEPGETDRREKRDAPAGGAPETLLARLCSVRIRPPSWFNGMVARFDLRSRFSRGILANWRNDANDCFRPGSSGCSCSFGEHSILLIILLMSMARMLHRRVRAFLNELPGIVRREILSPLKMHLAGASLGSIILAEVSETVSAAGKAISWVTNAIAVTLGNFVPFAIVIQVWRAYRVMSDLVRRGESQRRSSASAIQRIVGLVKISLSLVSVLWFGWKLYRVWRWLRLVNARRLIAEHCKVDVGSAHPTQFSKAEMHKSSDEDRITADKENENKGIEFPAGVEHDVGGRIHRNDVDPEGKPQASRQQFPFSSSEVLSDILNQPDLDQSIVLEQYLLNHPQEDALIKANFEEEPSFCLPETSLSTPKSSKKSARRTDAPFDSEATLFPADTDDVGPTQDANASPSGEKGKAAARGSRWGPPLKVISGWTISEFMAYKSDDMSCPSPNLSSRGAEEPSTGELSTDSSFDIQLHCALCNAPIPIDELAHEDGCTYGPPTAAGAGAMIAEEVPLTRKEKLKMRSRARLQERKKVWAERKAKARQERLEAQRKAEEEAMTRLEGQQVASEQPGSTEGDLSGREDAAVGQEALQAPVPTLNPEAAPWVPAELRFTTVSSVA